MLSIGWLARWRDNKVPGSGCRIPDRAALIPLSPRWSQTIRCVDALGIEMRRGDGAAAGRVVRRSRKRVAPSQGRAGQRQGPRLCPLLCSSILFEIGRGSKVRWASRELECGTRKRSSSKQGMRREIRRLAAQPLQMLRISAAQERNVGNIAVCKHRRKKE
jgi:hypothetical protein